MELVWALVVGVLFAGGIFLLLRRNPVRVILGLGLLGHGANLLIFVAGGLTRGRSPIVTEGATVLAPPYADPLPQALILTAIVIGFAVVAFALALFHRTYATLGGEAMDMDRLEGADV